MKRYERKSKEEIIDIFHRVLKCDNCVLYDDKADKCRNSERSGCIESVSKWLTSDIEIRPRYETMTSEQIAKLISACCDVKCGECEAFKYCEDHNGPKCINVINDYLHEKVEVTE